MAILKQINITNLDTNTTSSNPLGAEAENIDISRDSSGDITDVAHQNTSESLNTTLGNIEDKLEGVQNNFIGTLAEWNALTDAEKAEYDTYDMIDEFNTLPVDDALSSVSTNPVQNKVIKSALDTMNSNFQAGCNTIVQAVTAKGVTPASNSPSDIATAIGNISGGDTDHGAISISDFNNMTEAQLLALSSGKNYYGTDIDTTDTATRSITVDGVTQIFTFNTIDKYSCYINKIAPSEIISKTTITFDELKIMLDYSDRSAMVGKLVTGLTNSLYDGAYRIIGYDHDGSSHTYDLLTEDCVQRGSSGFGSSNRHYNDSGCYARIFAEETFYNAFDNEIKSSIKPMEVKYYYNASSGDTGTLQTNTVYGKLLSYNEIGYGISGPNKYSYAPSDQEGNLYPYFNNTTTSLRSKKYNDITVGWWLRSRYTDSTDRAGYIYTSGSANGNVYNGKLYFASVLRIG